MAPLCLSYLPLNPDLLTFFFFLMVSTCLAFVSWHELSLNFFIWNSGIPPFGGIWSGLKNKANAHSHAGLPWWLSSKEASCSGRNAGLIPDVGRIPGGGHGNSSILTWRIPWTEDPDGLQSIGSQRVSPD